MKLLTFAVAACALAAVQVQGENVPKPGLRSVPSPDKSSAPAKGAPVKGQMAGGTKVTARGQYPWMASIYADGGFICTGSWISNNFILTAASCVNGTKSLTIRIGMKRLLNEVFEDGSNQYDTDITYIHPNYTANCLANNIALVKYYNVMGNSQVVNMVSLPKWSDANKTFEGTTATLSGWGASYPGGPYIQDLQTADIPIIANSACVKSFPSCYVTSAVLCTKSAGNSNGACTGDQGAPLVYKDSAGKWTQLGIMSFVGGNCTTVPQAYTRVSSHLTWIQSVTKVNISP